MAQASVDMFVDLECANLRCLSHIFMDRLYMGCAEFKTCYNSDIISFILGLEERGRPDHRVD